MSDAAPSMLNGPTRGKSINNRPLIHYYYYKQDKKRSSITGGLVTVWRLCLNFSPYTIRTVLRRTSAQQTCFQLPITFLLIRGIPCTHMLTCTHNDDNDNDNDTT